MSLETVRSATGDCRGFILAKAIYETLRNLDRSDISPLQGRFMDLAFHCREKVRTTAEVLTCDEIRATLLEIKSDLFVKQKLPYLNAVPWRTDSMNRSAALKEAMIGSIDAILNMRSDDEAQDAVEKLFTVFIRLEQQPLKWQQAQAQYIQWHDEKTIEERAEEVLRLEGQSLYIQQKTTSFRRQALRSFASDMILLTHPDYRFLVDEACSRVGIDMSSGDLEEYGTRWTVPRTLMSSMLSMLDSEGK